MSLSLMAEVWESSEAEGSALLVLLALADFADDRGTCWPSQVTLARRARLSVRSVRRVLADLVESGAVELLEIGTGRHSTRYRVVPRGRTDCPPREDTGDRPGRTRVSAEPSKNHHEVQERPVPGRARQPDEVWDALVELLGFDPSGVNSRGRRNRAVKDLKSEGATGASVREAARRYVQLYGSERLTDTALATHYPALMATKRVRSGGPDLGKPGERLQGG